MRCILQKSIFFLSHFLATGLKKDLETFRLAQAGLLLIRSGGSPISPLISEVFQNIASIQNDDGGFADVRETIFAISLLRESAEYDQQVSKGEAWLANERFPSGGWGYSRRDRMRIPVTGLIHEFLPALATEESRKWMISEWKRDSKHNSLLSYKTAFVLMSFSEKDNNELTDEIERALLAEQEENGGFGPWRQHPAGPDAWCTGIALLAMSRRSTIEAHDAGFRALKYLKKTQRPQGFWPYHYLDTGASWPLYGMSSFIRSHKIPTEEMNNCK
jgi:hypothetical protein